MVFAAALPLPSALKMVYIRRQKIQNCKLRTSAGARAFKVEGPNIKVGGQIFLLILALEKHAVHNAITSINNSLMQSEIILLVVAIQNCFSWSISVIISNKILPVSARGSGGTL